MLALAVAPASGIVAIVASDAAAFLDAFVVPLPIVAPSSVPAPLLAVRVVVVVVVAVGTLLLVLLGPQLVLRRASAPVIAPVLVCVVAARLGNLGRTIPLAHAASIRLVRTYLLRSPVLPVHFGELSR